MGVGNCRASSNGLVLTLEVTEVNLVNLVGLGCLLRYIYLRRYMYVDLTWGSLRTEPQLTYSKCT